MEEEASYHNPLCDSKSHNTAGEEMETRSLVYQKSIPATSNCLWIIINLQAMFLELLYISSNLILNIKIGVSGLIENQHIKALPEKHFTLGKIYNSEI